MAGSSSSSHTMSAASLSQFSPASAALLQTLQNSPHEFLSAASSSSSTAGLQTAALQLVKRFLDPILEENGKTATKRRKTGDVGAALDTVYVDGFEPEQVWEQVKGVVEVAAGVTGEDNIERDGKKGVRFAAEIEEQSVGGSGSESESDDDGQSGSGSEGDEESDEGSDLEMEGADSGDELDMDGDMDEVDEDGMVLDGDDGEEVEFEDGEEDDDEEAEEEEEEEEEVDESPDLVEDKFGLNDGFFSIDDFNRQTELLELQDSRGTGPMDNDEDDEIDMHADPSEWADPDEDAEDSGDDADLKKALTDGKDQDDFEDSDDEAELDQSHENANDIMYSDFFAPPARKKVGNGNYKPKKPKQSDVDAERSRRLRDPKEAFETMQSEMERVRRDLFAEDSEPEDESDVDMDGNAPAARSNADPLSRRSKYEKQRTALMDQIRELEAANVAKREWTLAGEASAKSRPLNSLLEEDLEFERAGKPVPVITQEVTEGLEDMIKRRILKGEFDEVVKRRPDEISAQFRRGRVEIDDSKPSASLAEVYEKDVLAKQAADGAEGGAQPEEKDEKTLQDEKEIAEMWADVSRSLDALTNWHYTPKPPAPTLTIVADAPAISMEEAQPSAAAGGADANVSMLAPQEIYKPGHDKAVLPAGENNGGREIVGKSGIPINTREMTSEEKKRRRQREKSKIKKRNAMNGVSRGEVKEGSKKDVVDTLRKGGVTVIGKGGEKRSVDGKLVKEGDGKKAKEGSRGSHYKL